MKTMKIFAAILVLCAFGYVAQAADQGGGTETNAPGAKLRKHDGAMTLEEIDKALSERQAELKEVTSKGKTDIANAIQKVINDLNAMKTALNNKDTAAFKTANEQRKQDREALEALRKSEAPAKKQGKAS